MSLSYKALSELCDSLHNELTDVYTSELKAIASNKIISAKNTELETLVGSLNKRILQGYLH